MEEVEKKLKILAIQMSSVIGNKAANFEKVRTLIQNNIQPDTDVIILPEVWTVGWKCSEFQNSAETLKDSETVAFLSELAKKYNTNIIGGSFITEVNSKQETVNRNSAHQKYYNTCPVINRQGELVATYNKMHLFSYYGCLEGSYVSPGQNPVLVDLDGVKIGLSICYDIRFPELYREYRKSGADLLINMAAWPLSRAIHWESLTRSRAVENQCFMVALTQSGLIENDEYNLGHSRIIDYQGETVTEITQGEGAMLAELKFNDIYEFRNKCTVLKDIHPKYEVTKIQR